jgi:hypothetical protein
VSVAHSGRLLRRLLRRNDRRADDCEAEKEERFHGAMIQNWRRIPVRYISVETDSIGAIPVGSTVIQYRTILLHPDTARTFMSQFYTSSRGAKIVKNTKITRKDREIPRE